MACTMRNLTEPAECGACSREISPGPVVWSDEIDKGVPLCATCAASADPALSATIEASRALDETLAE